MRKAPNRWVAAGAGWRGLLLLGVWLFVGVEGSAFGVPRDVFEAAHSFGVTVVDFPAAHDELLL